MPHDPAFIVAACVAVTLVGLAKGGFAGLGALGTPIMALAISPVAAAAILLPILIVQDIVSVWCFRAHWNRRIVLVMLPGALVGVALGWAMAALVSERAVMAAVGAVTLLFGLSRLWIERRGRIPIPAGGPEWVGGLFGVATGFASQIAHAGSPPFQMWVAPKRLPHLEYVGTSAIVFALVNWAKVPAYAALGQFTRENLTIAAALLPVALLSTFAGVWLVRRVSGPLFYTLLYVLMVALGSKLLWDAWP
ncbi:sulfite exporter TauE/SafE family protein [Sphingomonas flavalba]|uniref:sulfite exporter TauE/SafE family protein n=1 Tax=Sphingomonas flavalba TaxID=2559804 RepID=UPI00109DD4DA|nr:sulfite exporter TauE/SafE family protein [Sphingomonas flavalba]